MKYLHTNIETINLVLIFIGFALFTTFVNSSVGSIVYRGVALFIGLICIFRNYKYSSSIFKSKPLRLFLLIYGLFTLKLVYEMYLGEDALTPFKGTRSVLMLFVFGIGWIPFLGAILSFDKIKQDQCLKMLFWGLVIIVGIGILNSGHSTSEIDGRASLNARQSTLAFGDNGAYLSIISAAYIFYKKIKSRVFFIIAVIGFIIGLYGAMIAGSRGPIASAVVGILFVISAATIRKKFAIVLFVGFLSLFGFVNLESVKDVAPSLYRRFELTFKKGDMSGRDVLFEEAWEKINDNLLVGSNPIILEPTSFSGYHNVYLGTGVALGLLGFFTFVGLVLYLLIASFFKRKKINSLFNLTMLALFWFYACRGITGVGLASNCFFTTILAYSCVILKRIK